MTKEKEYMLNNFTIKNNKLLIGGISA